MPQLLMSEAAFSHWWVELLMSGAAFSQWWVELEGNYPSFFAC